MALNKNTIGFFITPVDIKCNIPNLSVDDVSGINADKEFFEPSKQVGADTSKYKIVPNNAFACNLMHVGRDVVLPIALNHSGEQKIVSPAYSVFSFNGKDELLPEYFFIMLKSSETDRFFWFHTDSSIRDGMSWEDFCNTEITFPNIEIQRKYVAIYNSIQKNQHNYERGLEDLKLVIDSTLDNFKNKYPSKPVSDMLEEVNVRNTDNKHSVAMGINLNKQFMPSKSASANLSNYKIVNTGEFACNFMHVGRDEALPISMLNSPESVIVSPAYATMKVKPDSNILAQYIMMWFSRSETDRYTGFLCDGSVRGNLDLSSFMSIKMPVPSPNEQHALVELYNVYLKRLELNERLKYNLKTICPILIRGAITEAKAKA